MKINVFEGARRISKLLGGVYVIGCLSFAIFSEPYSRIVYGVATFDAPPLLAGECFDGDAIEFLNRKAPDGEEINVTLCFMAHRAESGELLVPYRDAGDGKLWMNERYSQAVREYTKEVARKFQLDISGIDAAKAKYRAALLEQWKNALLVLFCGLAVGWGLVVASGWIVRGFMGIPKGQDFRTYFDIKNDA